MLESLGAKDAEAELHNVLALGHRLVLLVVRAAVADSASVVHESNLFDMLAEYAVVVGLSEAKPT